MGSQSRIAELSAIIATSTDALDKHHDAQGIAPLSFDPSALPMIDYPPNVAKARQALLEATEELQALLAGPVMAWTKPPHTDWLVKQAIYRFQIANCFPSGKDEATYSELATASGLSESDLRRIVRAAMTIHIFRETGEGLVAHTAASKLFSMNEQMRQWVGMVSEELWPAATKVVDALTKFPGSGEPNESGFQLAHATNKTVFEFLADKPERAKRFADAMSMFNTGPGYELDHLVDNYPWEKLGKAVVVDIGGSHGSIAQAVAQRFPDITCIVQDLPEVIATAQVPEALQGRLSFQEHDFFNPQPIKDADVYFYKWIFHDWSDKYCLRILKALIPGLKPGARVILNEYLVPDPNIIPRGIEHDIRAFDLAMMEFQNSKERSVADLDALFTDADPRFKLTYVAQPEHAKLGIVEFTWQG